MDPFQVYMIMNFDKCMCPCNHYLSQSVDQLSHPESSLPLCKSVPILLWHQVTS